MGRRSKSHFPGRSSVGGRQWNLYRNGSVIVRELVRVNAFFISPPGLLSLISGAELMNLIPKLPTICAFCHKFECKG